MGDFGTGPGFDALFDRAVAGDASAWKPIVAELGPLVRGYLRAVGDPDPDGELRTAFGQLAEDVTSYRGERDELVMYLFDIVVARQRGTRRAVARGPQTVDSAPGRQLEPDVRDAVLLHRLARLQPKAIAYVLDCTAEQAKQWIDQGERQLADDQWGRE